jgi:two-component system chemotaxis response regulator CheY
MSVNRSVPVLVVHDYPTMASIVTTLLKQIGFEHVDGAGTGASALQKLARKDYALVISDETVGAFGGEWLDTMRANPRLAQTPVLMLTAQPDAASSNMASKTPCAATITKPFNARTLQTKIDAMLAA